MPVHAHNMANLILIANVGSRPAYNSEVNIIYWLFTHDISTGNDSLISDTLPWLINWFDFLSRCPRSLVKLNYLPPLKLHLHCWPESKREDAIIPILCILDTVISNSTDLCILRSKLSFLIDLTWFWFRTCTKLVAHISWRSFFKYRCNWYFSVRFMYIITSQ